MGARAEDEMPSNVCISERMIGCRFSSAMDGGEGWENGEGVEMELLLEGVSLEDDASLRGRDGPQWDMPVGGGGRMVDSERS